MCCIAISQSQRCIHAKYHKHGQSPNHHRAQVYIWTPVHSSMYNNKWKNIIVTNKVIFYLLTETSPPIEPDDSSLSSTRFRYRGGSVDRFTLASSHVFKNGAWTIFFISLFKSPMPFLSSDTCCVYVSCKLNASVPEIYGKTILLYLVTSYSCSSTLNHLPLLGFLSFFPTKLIQILELIS